MPHLVDDNIALYEQESLWDTDYLADPHYRYKVGLIRGMIPDDTRSVLDVGCGNGAVVDACPQSCRRIAGDRSWAALRHVRSLAVQLDAESLPFRHRSFDLVMSHQLLEHLPSRSFDSVVRELERVADRYLLISVPYRDRLAEQRARCGSCGFVYNVWGHVRRFGSLAGIQRLFPRFTLRAHAFCGHQNRYMSGLALWFTHELGGDWVLNSRAICPRCGGREQYAAGFPRRLIAAVARRVDGLIPRTSAFWWIVCLFERQPS